MLTTGITPGLPVAATMDLQYRLPPPQQLLFTPTILISVVVLVAAIIIMVYLSRRARIKARQEARREALKMVERILLKRGGNHDDADRMLYIFRSHPKLDPSSMIMVHDQFRESIVPLLQENFDEKFAERMEKLYFPPPKDTRHALSGQTKDVKAMVEDQKSTSSGQTAAAILDLMDATLKPGVLSRLAFDGVEGGYECLIMGHDLHSINVTLPAHNDKLVASIRPGQRIEGTLESGPSLMAFTSEVIQAVAGTMPYLRMAPWSSAWEIRKRDSMRLPISLEIDFQHISTAAADSIKMSSLHKEIGTLRPGMLMDVSLGGCCIETPSDAVFHVGDMVRFAKSLVSGNPPATLLGAVVNIDSIDPEQNEGSIQRLHIQFLVIDDVSQRILVRTLRQLQDVAERSEWMQAQQLLQKMRRARIQNIGSPAAAGLRRGDTDVLGTGTTAKKPRSTTNVNPPTRGIPKVGARPSTRRLPGVKQTATRAPAKPSDSSRTTPPAAGTVKQTRAPAPTAPTASPATGATPRPPESVRNAPTANPSRQTTRAPAHPGAPSAAPARPSDSSRTAPAAGSVRQTRAPVRPNAPTPGTPTRQVDSSRTAPAHPAGQPTRPLQRPDSSRTAPPNQATPAQPDKPADSARRRPPPPAQPPGAGR
ncbi:MAG: PilZ domain-containing protein [Planctomycetaceae bacterium]|nr:PilZ domain-containing protein [Planctomycetaceae bacterium]